MTKPKTDTKKPATKKTAAKKKAAPKKAAPKKAAPTSKKVLFSDALIAMKTKGKRVTRNSWPEGKELFFDSGDFCLRDSIFDRKVLDGFSYELVVATDFKVL